MMEPLALKIVRFGHAMLREKCKSKKLTLAHLLVLVRVATSGGEWLDTTTIAVATLTSCRYARELLDDLTDAQLLKSREINRRGDREFTLCLRGLQKAWPYLGGKELLANGAELSQDVARKSVEE
jgi:hypothetical protein